MRRLERFKAEQPRVAILLRQAVPAAWADGRKLVTDPTVSGLLDKLEEIYPPDAGGG